VRLAPHHQQQQPLQSPGEYGLLAGTPHQSRPHPPAFGLVAEGAPRNAAGSPARQPPQQPAYGLTAEAAAPDRHSPQLHPQQPQFLQSPPYAHEATASGPHLPHPSAYHESAIAASGRQPQHPPPSHPLSPAAYGLMAEAPHSAGPERGPLAPQQQPPQHYGQPPLHAEHRPSAYGLMREARSPMSGSPLRPGEQPQKRSLRSTTAHVPLQQVPVVWRVCSNFQLAVLPSAFRVVESLSKQWRP
jgi:hypothetical protein